MSGGYWDYIQYKLDNIIEEIYEDMESDYVKECGVQRELELTVHYLNLSRIYLHRLDWLISSDDSNETFSKRLKSDLNSYFEKLENNSR